MPRFDKNNDIQGPSSVEELEAAFASGNLSVNSLVSDGELVPDWTPIRDTPLRRRLEHLGAPAPAPTSPWYRFLG